MEISASMVKDLREKTGAGMMDCKKALEENDNDIKNGTAYATKMGIKITMPKWGVSRGEYFFDKERNIIAKGLTSVKHMGEKLTEELYRVGSSQRYTSFIDVLLAVDRQTSLDVRQLDILIKLDFFSEFGNQRELMRIADLFYNTFKKGDAKQIAKSKIEGTPLEEIVAKYAVGVTKSGGYAKSYTLLDVMSILYEAEIAVKKANIEDLSDVMKVKNFAEIMGYVGYVSGKPEDRRKLYVMDVYPLHRKADNKQFGYSIITKSIGSGVESRFTVFNALYNKDPIHKDDIILCTGYERDGPYFKLTGYSKIY